MHSVFFFKIPCPWVRFWYVSHSLLHFLSFSCIFLFFYMLSITFRAFSTFPVYQIHQAHCRQLWLPRITWSNSSVARLRSNQCCSSQPNEFQYYYNKTSRFQYYRVWFCDVGNYLCFFLHFILFIFRLKVFSTWIPLAVSRPVTWKQRHWKREVHSLHSPSRLQHVSSRAIQTFQKFQTPIFACLRILQIAWFALCFVSCFILLFLHLP